VDAAICRTLSSLALVTAIASCDFGASQTTDALQERLVGKWAAEQTNRDGGRSFLLLNNADGSFEMNERTTVPGHPPKTLVWKGKWSVVDGHYKLQIATLNGTPLGATHPLRSQSFKIEESTESSLVLLHDEYKRSFDRTGALRDDYTYRYARTH